MTRFCLLAAVFLAIVGCTRQDGTVAPAKSTTSASHQAGARQPERRLGSLINSYAPQSQSMKQIKDYDPVRFFVICQHLDKTLVSVQNDPAAKEKYSISLSGDKGGVIPGNEVHLDHDFGYKIEHCQVQAANAASQMLLASVSIRTNGLPIDQKSTATVVDFPFLVSVEASAK